MRGLLYLALAIVSEVFGSTMLKLSEGFTQAWPIAGVIVGFLSAFTFLSFSLKTIDLSSAYATWSGVGTALTAIVGFLLFGETISLKGVFGLTLVIAGVVVLNQSKAHAEDKKQTACE
ncbi:multidrug efflux SMR transporter subunit EbrB [Bacillus subtilis]|uniref:Multidrug resistance protein EbrB n=5 Tax=Bacillus subtilis TaxID=1423 RepID=EBRB_BACSU|nr:MULTISPECIES: multidrug efflux SMR transporter subunit EbrB [Bacillales]NP_389611.1 small toxic metabolite efflux transporter subunit [Bacillus subtilis subsp. subtilis str. 168]P0CW82.1 RecName: Full=Multidrug resistance protein EbrB [Bacillus subtilis subsp. subtilis str. 168]AOL29667.1 multidrug transporter [Alkalicoccobacillus gibsonii]MBW4826814.1 multidrug efflux SMR transporter subunit EbrB [Bacillaceae bacterium]MDP4113199.1 multidrug efflux SMR transporter subunit EbrB [Bacillota b